MRVERGGTMTSYNEVIYVEGKELDDVQATAFLQTDGEWAADVWIQEARNFIIMGAYATREEAEAHAEALYLSGVWK